MIGGEQPLVPDIFDQSDRVGANRRFSLYFRSQRLSRNTCVKTVRDKVVGHSLA